MNYLPLFLILFGGSIFALPGTLSVISGDANPTSGPQTLQIAVSDQAILEWDSFSIGLGETVEFIQSDTASIVLNRVTGADMSQLLGSVEANGQVYFINVEGILIGAAGAIDAAGFLASTFDLENAQFLAAGEMEFTGDSDAAIIHLGSIEASSGNIALFAHQIESQGDLNATNGYVSVLAGHDIILEPASPPVLSLMPDTPAEGIGNFGTMEALDAYIEADSLSNLAIRQNGNIALSDTGGQIVLATSGGLIAIDKSAILTAPGGDISIDIASSSAQRVLYVNGTLDTSGAPGGAITLTGDSITHGGSLNSGTGQITIHANQSYIETSVATLSALGGGISTFGNFHLCTGNHTSTGGTIYLLGNQITLVGARIDASGGAMGGQVFIGGGYLGTNPDVYNAKQIYLSPTTTILANGTDQGGQIILWSNTQTENYASLSTVGSLGGLIAIASGGTLVQKGTTNPGTGGSVVQN